MAGDELDYQRNGYHDLADRLKALANERRLRILKDLAVERRLRDIRARLTEKRLATVGGNGHPAATISDEAVRRHLHDLKEAGVVVAEPDADSKEGAHLWSFEPRGLHVIIEELREFFDGASAEAPWVTREASGFQLLRQWNGPRLILLHGSQPGEVYPLKAEGRTKNRGWVIGRTGGLAVTLDYDAYLSAENSEIVQKGGEFELIDLRTSRNGTYLNFRKLAPGAHEALRDGDIVGVGRSLLQFRD